MWFPALPPLFFITSSFLFGFSIVAMIGERGRSLSTALRPGKAKEEMLERYGERKATAMTAQMSAHKTANLSRLIFRAPPAWKLLIPSIVICFLYGTLLDYVSSGGIRYLALYLGGILFLLPFLVTVPVSMLLDKTFGGRLSLRRSVLLGFIDLCVMAPFFITFLLLRNFFALDIYVILIFCYAVVIWARHLFIISISNSKHLRSLLPTLSHTIFGSLAVHFVYPPPVGYIDILLISLFSLIFLVTIIWFLETVRSPVQSDFRTDLWENVGYAIAHFTERGTSGVKGLEDLFSTFSEPMDVFIGVVGFRRPGKESSGGDEGISGGVDEKGEERIDRRLKALMIIPSIHPGPFGIIGGSNLTLKVAGKLGDITENALMFHGPATHDINISATRETGKVERTVRDLAGNMEFTERASPFVRYHDKFHMSTQFFGKKALNVYTSSPEPTDDIDHNTGYVSVLQARLEGAEDAILIDAHNCLEPGIGGVHFGTRRSFEILKHQRASLREAKGRIREGIRGGVAQDKDFVVDDGIGDFGIQAMVIETAEQTAAYILYDGNNMVPGLREEIISAAEDMVDEAEVYTSDNHRVNVNFGGYNPVGLQTSKTRFVERTRKLVERALEDLEPVEVGFKTGKVKGLRVFGVENTARLTSILNASTSILVKSALATITIAVLGCALVMTMLP